MEKIESASGSGSQESQTEGTFRRSFAAGLLLEAEEDDAPLMTVRQAAEFLGLCTATVYALCAEGALRHVRILNAIRIRPSDVRAFIALHRSGVQDRYGS
jgi:excisionase family DNA binding protein